MSLRTLPGERLVKVTSAVGPSSYTPGAGVPVTVEGEILSESDIVGTWAEGAPDVFTVLSSYSGNTAKLMPVEAGPEATGTGFQELSAGMDISDVTFYVAKKV